MLDANWLIQTILSNREATKGEISWAAMERSAYKVHSVLKQNRPEKDSEIVPKIKKGALLFCSSQHSAEAVKWQNVGFTGLKSSSKRDGWKKE